MSTAFLSRIALRRDTAANAIAPLLVPSREEARHSAAHHLLWTLFADHEQRQRDFLWREIDPGRFMVLSARPPEDAHALFDIESKPFAPALGAGDRLTFILRANATVDRSQPGRARSKRHDIVMDALHAVPKPSRHEKRDTLTTHAAQAWLLRQGERAGFIPDGTITPKGCDVVRIPRKDSPRPAVFGIMNLSGVLRVDDPALFLPALLSGFGRARAFGCGLMLIRRAP